MDPKEILRKQFLKVVNNQLRDNEPPITAITLDRLIQEGYKEADAKQLIAVCVGATFFDVVNKNEAFDLIRYEALLKKLPQLPE
ncbi:MAG: hypothetical protein DHS20C18_36510 [Saprospiraceae bacterium]|nr:MAG: hypothetical protein DHS20C18_36510 [Saprospiraceae bacterium]